MTNQRFPWERQEIKDFHRNSIEQSKDSLEKALTIQGFLKKGIDDTTTVEKYKDQWTKEGFRVHVSNRGYHSDAVFCVVKPGCVVSLRDIQDYKTEFPGWDVLYLPDQSWDKVSPFLDIKSKVGGRWWLKGEEHNDQLIK